MICYCSFLEQQFGIYSVVLEWFRSLSAQQLLRAFHGRSTSTTIHIVCPVPEGSVLGPRLFILYNIDRVEVVTKHNVNIHVFSDGTELYRHCHRDEMPASVVQLELCIAEVSRWMSSANRLKLNPEKTELLWMTFSSDLNLN